MKCRLRSYDYTPPGGYPYQQTEGKVINFASQPSIEAQAQIVSAFRRGNGLSRSSVKEALEDIDQFTCQRMGCMPSFCVPADAVNVVALNASSPIVTPCATCGVKIG